MKSKMLGALALFTLIGALFVMQSAATSTPTVNAATGSIDALNVGTCLTTDADIGWYDSDDCGMLSNDAPGTANDWEVREKIAEVSTLYATYAHDPKTASGEPRAILTDSDLLKISIADSGRDKRTGVLLRGVNQSALTDNTATTTVDESDIAVIKGLLADKKIETPDDFAFEADNLVGIETNGTAGVDSSVIAASGNVTLNISGGTSFKPMDVKGKIRFFGCITDQSACAYPTDDIDADGDKLKDITSSLVVDEDAGEGKNGTGTTQIAPWLSVNASVPTGDSIQVHAIYYETSMVENLVGGRAYHSCNGRLVDRGGDTGWKCDRDADNNNNNDRATVMADDPDDVVYTSNEKDRNTALDVTVSADGDDRSANLYLTETGRFTGRYEGFIRLTDANGDGAAATDNPSTSVDETQRMDWGLDTKDAISADEADAAVLGVESGPITITYRDTDGKKQTLRIEVDAQPPTINVVAPAHGSSSGDQSPDFSGTIEDIDSGLADNSFRLVIDNVVDTGPGGDNNDFVLYNRAPNADGVKGTDTDGLGRVTHTGEYTGYDAAGADAQVGVTMASSLYNLGDDSCSDQDLCHILAESYDDGANRGTFDDSIRLDLRDGSQDAEIRDMEYEIDFQAFVMDMAGNIGFSDSDPANPRFINDLGTKEADRKKPNVLGYYSAHVITLDEKDPDIDEDQTATGYYGLDSDGKPTIQDRSSVMVVFDGPIAASSVSNSTFSVELDDGSSASVIDHEVAKNYVFLKLASELASDATPKVDIVNGEKVEDMAGNETFGREQNEFEAKDGISPRLMVTLSGGSGSGTGDEGPEKLTKDKITVHVSSDEPLQGSPRIAVVCSSLAWNTGGTDDPTSGPVRENASGVVGHDIDDFVANRNGSFVGKPNEDPAPNMTSPRSSNTKAAGADAYQYTCGYDVNPEDTFEDNFQWTDVPSQARPGENWEYTWQNQTGAEQMLRDAAVTAVAFARDRSSYSKQNWGSASAEFTLDTKVVYPDPSSDLTKGGDLQPAPDGQSKEARPFVLIEFDESTTITLDSVELDGVEIASEFETPDHNRFLYWPDSLSKGDHEVDVEATDAAGNEASFSYDFEVVARGDFVIGLNAGWNAISVPADPVDTAIGSVFTDSAITTVIGWDTQGWRIAMRRDGVWESNEKYGALNEIRAKYGYWVKSEGFVRQPVALKGGTSRDAGGTPILISIPTEPGWNFVGVVDQDGDQTEDDFTETLKDSENNPIPASEYLGMNYVRAYTWDATLNRFDVVRKDHTMTIGDGVWVYYPEGTGIAP